MQTATAPESYVDAYVHEYFTLIEEGWQPDLHEFLRRVPDEMREEVFQAIDAACANPEEIAEDDHLLPATEISVESLPPAGLFGRIALGFVPKSIRSNFSAEWRSTRHERMVEGRTTLDVFRLGLGDILQGVAQHAPLREPHPDGGETPAHHHAVLGWLAWRLSGVATLTGVVMGNAIVLIAGGLLLGFAIAASVRCCYAPDEASRRLLNGVLGGTVVALAGLMVLGAVTVAAIMMSAVLGWGGLAAFAVRSLVVLGAFMMALVTASGWSPQPWWPRRLIRV
jgi:hypothetical protein